MLRAVRHGILADRAFERHAASLDAADRRLAQELAYGVLRLRGRLDHVIAQRVRGGIGRLEPEVLDILRLGAYQLLELDRVPAYAAVSDAVEAAKSSAGRGATSLVNAVLRVLARESYASFVFPSRDDDPLGYFVCWGSHPRWLVERWLARWPPSEVERLIDYDNSRPALYLTASGAKEEALGRLAAAGIAGSPVGRSRASLRIEPADLARALDAVPAVVQDPGAAAVVDYLALDPGVPVVDLCAAPGGKAALLAMRGHPVVALDVSRSRLARLLENRARLGVRELQVAVADSTRPPVSAAPAVLLDAPCTGTGTLARHPDGRWRLRRDDFDSLVDLQRRLLESAARLVAPGGTLVYATCSLELEENEEQVEAFLLGHADFVMEPPVGAPVPDGLVGTAGELRVLPQHHQMDGVYAARFRRRAG